MKEEYNCNHICKVRNEKLLKKYLKKLEKLKKIKKRIKIKSEYRR